MLSQNQNDDQVDQSELEYTAVFGQEELGDPDVIWKPLKINKEFVHLE